MADTSMLLLGGLFRSVGTPDVPLFAQSPEKRRHTLVDLGRQAERAGLAFAWPTRFPVNTVLALRMSGWPVSTWSPVETFWLPFPFTMNWRFTRPGMISFKKGEPFCFIMPIPHETIDEVQPIVKSIHDDPDLKAQYEAWGASRTQFLDRLSDNDSDAIKSGWQRDYFRGRTPEGHVAPDSHISRRRLKSPRKAEPGE